MPNFLAEDEDQSEYLDPIDAPPRPFMVPPRKPMGDAPLTDAPAPRPIGAGNQPTIRELLNPQPPQGPGLTSDTEDGARPESDPATDAMSKAQERALLIARANPTMPEPKWWQRALAGVAGGAAGYVNASGRTRVDPTGAIQGIYGVPQFQRKTQDWQNKADAADLESAQASGNLTTLQRMRQLKTAEQRAAEESADRKTRMENDAAAKDEIETTKRQGQAVKQQEDLMKPFGADAYLQKEGTPVPPGYEIDQAPASPGMVIVHPARMQELTEDLASYASGRKVGQKIPYTEWRKAQDKKADAEKSYNSKLDPAAKENPNQWEADSINPDPKISGPARQKLAAHRQTVQSGRAVTYFNSPEGQSALDETGKSLANYELSAMKDVAGRSAEQRSRIFAIARKYNPEFNTSEVDRRIKKQDYYDNGKGADSLRSFGTFLEHGGAALDAANAIGQTNSRLINKPLNWWKTNASGDPNFQAFMTALEPVRKEFEGFLLGGRALQGDDRHQAEIILNDNSGIDAIKAALKQMGHTAQARFNEENYSYKRVMKHDLVDPFSPEAVEGARRIGVNLGGGGGGERGDSAPPMPSVLSAADVGKVYTGAGGKRMKITAVNPQNPKQFKSEDVK